MMRTFAHIATVMLIACISPWAASATWYVDEAVSASGDGTTWSTAFKTIQEGIDAASNGDTVIVEEGVYVENIAFNGKNIVLRSTNPLDWDVVADTVIDGNDAGSVVTFANTENETCTLSGFTIRNGLASKGGGIYGGTWQSRTHATIENNIITGNSVTGSGGGILYCDGPIRNNRICGNSAQHGAGLSGCKGVIENNVIADNAATGWGGGVHICEGIVRNNIIAHNSATQAGGMYWSSQTVTNNIVIGNSAQYGGGLYQCGANIRGNLIVGNAALSLGGGLYDCAGNLTNNSIIANAATSATGGGGGLRLCPGTVKNCIIWGNSANTDPQISDSSTPTYSCIEDWTGGGTGNTSSNPSFLGDSLFTGQWSANPSFDATTCRTTLTNSSASWQPGALAGLTLNPDTTQVLQFYIASNTAMTIAVWGDASAIAAAGDSYRVYNYRLAASSPCMDSGENESWMSTATDLDGHTRILYGCSSLTVDMGAYESGEAVPPVITLLGSNPLTLQVKTPYSEPGYTATDNLEGNITSRVVVTGSVNHNVLGAYVLHYNVTDSSGNPAEEKTRTVNVVDITPPVITLQGYNPLNLTLGTPYVEPGYTASDNYDGNITVNVVRTGSVDHNTLGTYILRYNVTDSSANAAVEKTRTVNVVNDAPPVITLTPPNPMTLAVGTPYSEPGYTATDDMDGNITSSVVVTGSVNHMLLGSYTLRYNVTDSFGNHADEKRRTVNVVDTSAPVITLSGANPMTLQVGTPYAEPGFTATDNYDGNLTGSVVVTGSINHTQLGTYTLRYNVSDSSGNPALEKTRTVNIVDSLSPVITLSGDNPMGLEAGTPYSEPGYSATDNYDGDITASVAVTGSVNHTVLGNYSLRYNVSDSSGNPAAEKTRTVNVIDTTPPSISLLGEVSMTIEFGTPYTELGYTATDNYDGDLTATVAVSGSVDHTTVGSYTLRYNVSDSSGNPAEQKTRTVRVVDSVPPEITLLGDNPVTIEGGTPYEEPGYTATDNYDGDITAQVTIKGSVDHTYPGSYALKYKVTDSSGNPAQEKTRIVTVADTTGPVIVLTGDNPMTLEVGTPYEDPGYSATDNCDGDLTSDVIVTGSVDRTVVGTYTLRYNVSDWTGNPAEQKTRIVHIVDTAPPQITLLGDNPLTLQAGSPYEEPGYTASDDYDGDLTAQVRLAGSVDHSTPGTYVLRYNVMDSSGNPAEEKTRTVNVVDTGAPVITLLGENPLALEVGTPYSEAGYTATDAADGDLTGEVAVTGTVDHNTLGSYTLHYNVSDSAGNPAEERTRAVNVIDTMSPVIILLGDDPVSLEVGTPYSEPGYTASDNYDGDLTVEVVIAGSVDHTVLGTYTLSYNVSDSSSNPAEQRTRRVTVVDTTSPVIALSGDDPLTLEAGTPYMEPGYSATDNCDGDMASQVSVSGSVNHTVLGNYHLRYNVSDSSGNPAEEKTRTVNVVDTTPPTITFAGDNPLSLKLGMPYSEPGYSATDIYDGDLTAQVTVTGVVDHTTEGTYVLTYNVSDSSGNPADEKSRTVNVVSTTAFNVTAIFEVATGTVQLIWPSTAGAVYTVWSCDELCCEEWYEEATIVAESDMTFWTDHDAGTTSKFYRVEMK
ncbi:MAG: DUF5011 domain-containing protein [bacterium]|nr:DUF5011 domain-containing protein [bacterium]